jgi:hypothetical protein
MAIWLFLTILLRHQSGYLLATARMLTLCHQADKTSIFYDLVKAKKGSGLRINSNQAVSIQSF